MKRRGLCAGTVALTGCSVLPQTPYLQRRDWPLDVHRTATVLPRRRGRVLLVRSLRAAPGLEARGLQWLQRDGSVHVDFYEQWAVPPAQAVEDDLRRWLADAGLFVAVIAPGSQLSADFILEGELTVFVAEPSAGRARAALALVLLDQRNSPTKVLLQRTEAAEVRLADQGPQAIAEAMRAAIVEVLHRTEVAIGAAVR